MFTLVDFVADVDQADETLHRFGVVDLEGVVQREGIDIDDRGLDRLRRAVQLDLDQLTLGRDQQHRHLQTLAGRIQDLEIQLDVVHVEGDVLLGLPPDDLAGLGSPSCGPSRFS